MSKPLIPLKITIDTLLSALSFNGLEFMRKRRHSASFIVQTAIFLHVNNSTGRTHFDRLLDHDTLNLFVRDFLNHYCEPSGGVDWVRLAELIKSKEQEQKKNERKNSNH
jgi:hypothetical protein